MRSESGGQVDASGGDRGSISADGQQARPLPEENVKGGAISLQGAISTSATAIALTAHVGAPAAARGHRCSRRHWGQSSRRFQI